MNVKEPTHWGGGRIYHSQKKGGFRCYKRSVDKVESTFHYGTNAAKKDKVLAWERAVDAIVKDKRPRL